MNSPATIHGFRVEGIDGGVIDFADFQGKKILVVNVASACGFTPQYQQLQELYEAFPDKVTVVGFPTNAFGGQEPGSNAEIRAFCTQRYGVTFPLAAKIDIRTHPLFRWLCQRELNGVLDCTPSWNFCKFVLDEGGRLTHFFPPEVSPLDEALLEALGISLA